MRFRSFIFGLVVIGAAILAACGESSGQTTVPATATDSPSATIAPSPTPTATAATSPVEKTEVPVPVETPRPTATPGPVNIEPIDETPAPQPADDRRQGQDLAFYEQDGLALEYYWPLDERGNLSADETEILAYNTSGETMEFRLPAITFTESGIRRNQSSGTWEKFPSRASWDRIEYIQIPPSPYGGEPLLVLPGEKVKLHWHMEGVTSAGTAQSVMIDLTVVTPSGTERITETLVRDVEGTQPPAVAAATPEPTPVQQTSQPGGHDAPSGSGGGDSNVRWMFNGNTWSPNALAPSCPEPFEVQTPVDMSLVTAALWPGQSRGGYKGHGGFRFDSSDADSIIVRAPVGGHLVQAARYLEGTEEQILLFFTVPCGFFYRFDHVSGLSPKIEDALKVITGPVTTDSRTTFMNPPLWVEQGEIVGTSVGIPPSNIFVDFGLYDVRQPNNVVPNPAWADSFANDKEFGHYGVCFFDYLPGSDGETMRSLPTGKEGPTSDYCD